MSNGLYVLATDGLVMTQGLFSNSIVFFVD